MKVPGPATRSTLGWFRDARLGTRVHLVGRWASCPFEAVEALVPRTGCVLDVGCAHGAFAALLAVRSADRHVHGVDVDAGRIATGTRLLARTPVADRVRLEAVPTAWRPEPVAYDAIVLVDVLYLLGRDEAQGLLSSLVAALRPGGRLVVKEMADGPAWKRRWAVAQERLAVDVVGLTEGETVEILSEAAIVAPLHDAGCSVERFRLDRGYVHPHLAFRATAP